MDSTVKLEAKPTLPADVDILFTGHDRHINITAYSGGLAMLDVWDGEELKAQIDILHDGSVYIRKVTRDA